MVLKVELVTAPVIAMEASCGFLLCIVQDGVGGGSCWGVVQYIRQEGGVHLNSHHYCATIFIPSLT